MNRARIQIAKPDILKLFDELPQKVHKQSELAGILTRERSFWRLTQSTTTNDFIKFLMTSGKLRKIVFPFPKPYNRETRYAWGDVPKNNLINAEGLPAAPFRSDDWKGASMPPGRVP